MKNKGFSIVELIIVLVIIGVLAAMAIPRFVKSQRKQQAKATQQQTQIEKHYKGQEQYDLCMSKKPNDVNTYNWREHCEKMTIALHSHEVKAGDDDNSDRYPIKNYQGNYNGKAVECLNGVLYYKVENYDNKWFTPVFQPDTIPQLILCKE